ncbi:OmpA family protein [Limimaricola sp.]|uniref:OmpA family protein n=1 Tax=Limimaricola sp. TaxID=2211665 RepID=UPI0040591166
MRRVLTAMGCALSLAACTAPPGFDEEAGRAGAGFGAATNANMIAHSRASEGLRVDLARRFAAEVDTTINFAFDSAVLDAAARATLHRQADWIRRRPELRFRVYGHTDLVGPPAYNEALGLRRARAAVAYLVSQGLDAARLEAVASFGETRPLVATGGPERANRRTVTEVSGFVRGHPNLLNGKYAAVVFEGYVESAAVPSTLAQGASGGEGLAAAAP